MREFKRKKGYVTIAQRSGKINYLRMAYALALSLKATQSEVPHLSVLVTPGMKIPKKYAEVFDEVIEIPWGDDSKEYKWKIHNKWKVFHMTPYEETVLLDADMIFPTDVSHWWDSLYEKDAWFATTPVTYSGSAITPGAYRHEFVANRLPMIYTAFAYFQQTDPAMELFRMVEQVYKQWPDMFEYYRLRGSSDDDLLDMMDRNGRGVSSWMRWGWTHFFQDFPWNISGDLAFATAIKLLGAEDQFTGPGKFPTFVHMKPADQGLPIAVEADWQEVLSCNLRSDMTLLVGNYRQQYPFHYVEKGWLTDDIVRKLEKAANG